MTTNEEKLLTTVTTGTTVHYANISLLTGRITRPICGSGKCSNGFRKTSNNITVTGKVTCSKCLKIYAKREDFWKRNFDPKEWGL